jgi:hypothetical protein
MKLLIFCGLLNTENKQAVVDMLVSNNVINVNDSVADNDITQLNDHLLVLQQTEMQTEFKDKVAVYFYNGDVAQLSATPLNSENYHFISFYSAPEVSIVSSLSENDWFSHSNAILDLHLSNMANSYVINQADIAIHNDQFLKLIMSASGLALNLPKLNQKPVDLIQIAQIAQSINSIKNKPQLQQLFEQLEGSTDLTKDDYGLSVDSRQEYWLTQLLNSVKNTQQYVKQLKTSQDDLQQQHNLLKEQQTTVNAENQLALLQISQLQEELEQAHIQSEKDKNDSNLLIERIEQQHAIENALFVEKLDKSKRLQTTLSSENELALLQISQLQEELEQVHINSEKDKNDSKALIEQVEQIQQQQTNEKALLVEQLEQSVSLQTTLSSENELALLQISQLQEELEQLHIHSEKDKNDNKTLIEQVEQIEQQQANEKALLVEQLEQSVNLQTTLSSENELALLQISQLQEELEQTFLNSQELQQQLKYTNNEFQLLENGFDKNMANSISVEHYTANSNEYQAQINQLEMQISNLKAENELALLQINQLQEELEFYFIKHQQSGVWSPLVANNDTTPNYLRTTLTLLAL